MRISTFILSFCGFCVLYISNADWIDELIEDYLGSDYEEVAPFVSSVTAGTEEFDQLVEELSQSTRRWWLPSPLILVSVLSALMLAALMHWQVTHASQGCEAIKKAFEFVTGFRRGAVDREEVQTIVSEFLERKLKQLCKNKPTEDVPVKLLWKGGTLIESSIHCSLREEAKLHQMQRRLVQSKLSFPKGEGDKAVALAPSSSETSTVRKMAKIREMLESEPEIQKPREVAEAVEGTELSAAVRKPHELGEMIADGGSDFNKYFGNAEAKAETGRNEEVESNLIQDDSEWEVSPDPKLMNRIRLLESRLRLEELKNRNWINRMSRAEDILQQLNKQVELIEETRPLRTLTETLKITSTVTNWDPSSRPRRNMQFTLVNQYPSCCMSLSELIKKEVGLPTAVSYSKIQIPPTPQIPALPSPIVMPQSSFLSKFLCR